MADDQEGRPFDVGALEEDIAEVIGAAREFAPPAQRGAPSAEEVGRLTTDAITRQYDEAVKAMEAMGETLVGCVRNAQAMAAQCQDAIAYIKETAEYYRAEAEKVTRQVEHATDLTVQVRAACNEMRSRLNMSVPKE